MSKNTERRRLAELKREGHGLIDLARAARTSGDVAAWKATQRKFRGECLDVVRAINRDDERRAGTLDTITHRESLKLPVGHPFAAAVPVSAFSWESTHGQTDNATDLDCHVTLVCRVLPELLDKYDRELGPMAPPVKKGTRGRKRGSGEIDDTAILQFMHEKIGTGECNSPTAAANAALDNDPDKSGHNRESTITRVVRKYKKHYRG